ncbi:schlafen family member 13-like, partial [Paramuricea clavata]
SGESESNAEEDCTGQSSPKRSKPNERERDPSFAEILFDIDIIYHESKEKKRERLQNLIKHIVALLNSAGGVIRINESGNDEKTIIKQRDIWKQGLEQTLVDILTQDEYKQCIHFNSASKFPYCYLFVRKSKRVCTQSSGLKIPLECSVKDATYNGILNILHQSVSQRESSSLEMSDENMEPDSGYTDNSSTFSFPDEEHAEFHYEKNVSFHESDTVQFKFIIKDLLKGIDSHLPNYVSAFANHRGGKVYFGIHDDGTVKGQLVEGEDEKREVKDIVEKVMKRKNENQEMVRIWGKPDFIPQYDEQWTVEFVEVIGKPEGEERCVVVVKIFPFDGGMFLEHPLAWKVDESSEEIVKIDFVEWRNLHASGSGS